MGESIILVGGKKAEKFGPNLFLIKRTKYTGEWIAINDIGEIIDRDDYYPKDMKYIPELNHWATMTAQRGRKNVRFSQGFGSWIG